MGNSLTIVISPTLEDMGYLSLDNFTALEFDWICRSAMEIEQSQGSPNALGEIENYEYYLKVRRMWDAGTNQHYYTVMI